MEFEVWYSIPGLGRRCSTVRAPDETRAAEAALVNVRNATVERVNIAPVLMTPGAIEEEDKRCRNRVRCS